MFKGEIIVVKRDLCRVIHRRTSLVTQRKFPQLIECGVEPPHSTAIARPVRLAVRRLLQVVVP